MTSTPGSRSEFGSLNGPERETTDTSDGGYPFGEPGWPDEDTLCPCCGDELSVGDESPRSGH
ncbi:hypothetical protein [Streptomyces sp. 4F14]|uniref:hypothetical protein n=1 Tax=Streptomyces sp. 4F14 TaxID=3394380 RepID=UPI003A843C5D